MILEEYDENLHISNEKEIRAGQSILPADTPHNYL